MNRKLLFTLVMMLFGLATPALAESLTVYDGENYNSYAPIYGLWTDSYLKCEYVIPANDLSEMNGSNITSLTWYCSTKPTKAWGGNFKIFLKEVGETTLSDFTGLDGATLVFEGPLDASGDDFIIEFAQAYTYQGGNLLIGIYNTEKGAYSSAAFRGVTVEGACVQGYSSSSLDAVSPTQRNFIAQTSFEFVPAGTVVYYKPKNLQISEITPNSAKLTWEAGGDETAWNVGYKKATEEEWIDVPVTETSYLLEDLANNTTYDVRVQGNYGDGNLSGWTASSFKTLRCNSEDMGQISYSLTDSYGDGWNGNKINVVDENGEVLQTLTITSGSSASGTIDICFGETLNFEWVVGSYPGETSFVLTDPYGETILECSNGANLGAGVIATYTYAVNITPKDLAISEITANSAKATWEGVTEAYNLRYRTTRTADISFFEDFENGLDNWTVVDSDGDGYNWQIVDLTTNFSGQLDAYDGTNVVMSRSWISSSIGAVEPDQWLISPKIENLGGTLRYFVMDDGSGYPETYRIYVSTTDTEIASFEPLTDEMQTPNALEWTELRYDLSAYEGQEGYIAFRHYNCTDKDFMFIDAIEIFKNEVPTGEWVTVEEVNSPYTIEGLKPLTEYEVQVQAIADEREVSKWTDSVLFTTLEGEEETGIEELYMVGTFNGWNQTEEGGRIAFEFEDGQFMASADLEAGAEFKLITPLANPTPDQQWQWFGGVDENQVGYFLINEELLGQGINLVNGSNFRIEEGGSYIITVCEGPRGLYEPLRMFVTKSLPTAITDINSDSSNNTWYNIQGMKLQGVPTVPGIYINGGKKVIIK